MHVNVSYSYVFVITALCIYQQVMQNEVFL